MELEMKIEIKSIKDVGSCNFCQRSKGDWEAKSRYHYSKVYEIKGRNIGFRICENCMLEFTEIMVGLPLIQDLEENER